MPALHIDSNALSKKHDEGRCTTHPEKELRKLITSNQAIQIRPQCLICGLPAGPTRKKAEFTEEQLAGLPLWDKEIASRHQAERSAAYTRLKESEENRLRQVWFSEYNKYLRSPEWRQKRDLALKRDGFWCQGCHQQKATQAHHLTYEHVFQEFLFELISVCDDCHKRLHIKTEMPDEA